MPRVIIRFARPEFRATGLVCRRQVKVYSATNRVVIVMSIDHGDVAEVTRFWVLPALGYSVGTILENISGSFLEHLQVFIVKAGDWRIRKEKQISCMNGRGDQQSQQHGHDPEKFIHSVPPVTVLFQLMKHNLRGRHAYNVMQTKAVRGSDMRVEFFPSENFRELAETTFASLRSGILAALPYAVVEHVGSTVIPGCLTKGDLDLSIVVSQRQFSHALAILDTLFAPNTGSDRNTEFAAFVDDNYQLPVGLQLVAAGTEADTFVSWRGLLLKSAGTVERYNRLKSRHQGGDMDRYRTEKSEFIEAELARLE